MSSGETNAARRLWVVSELYYPEETSTGYYLTRIAEGLAEDFDVKVICGQPTYSARGTVAPKHEVHKGVEIFRAAGTTLDKNVIPFRLLNMVTLGLSILFKALAKFQRGDRVLVVTTPPSMPFVIALASLTKGAAYTLVIHDNYPEILVATEKTTGGSLLFKAMTFFNRWLYKHASKVIVVGRDMRELVAKKNKGSRRADRDDSKLGRVGIRLATGSIRERVTARAGINGQDQFPVRGKHGTSKRSLDDRRRSRPASRSVGCSLHLPRSRA
jgi:hypothetical protein